MECILEIQNVSKTFEGKELLKDINIQVNRGEIYGLLGPNGAGKTTLMKTILNLIKPTTGFIKILNHGVTDNNRDYLRQVGSLIEVPHFYDNLTGRENLALHAEYMSYRNPQRILEVFKLVKLEAVQDIPVKKYSLGMKQRLAIARAILTQPDVLILDEPINGLDPSGIHDVRELLRTLAKTEGITILISSHILAEVEQIVDKIAIIDKGVLVEELTINEMRSKSNAYIKIMTPDAEKVLTHLVVTLNIENYKMINTDQINIYDATATYQDIIRTIAQTDFDLQSVETIQTTLEEYFLNSVESGDLDA